jgi:hypothetical protein
MSSDADSKIEKSCGSESETKSKSVTLDFKTLSERFIKMKLRDSYDGDDAPIYIKGEKICEHVFGDSLKQFVTLMCNFDKLKAESKETLDWLAERSNPSYNGLVGFRSLCRKIYYRKYHTDEAATAYSNFIRHVTAIAKCMEWEQPGQATLTLDDSASYPDWIDERMDTNCWVNRHLVVTFTSDHKVFFEWPIVANYHQDVDDVLEQADEADDDVEAADSDDDDDVEDQEDDDDDVDSSSKRCRSTADDAEEQASAKRQKA